MSEGGDQATIRRSGRLVSIIPASHWMRMGYTEGVSNALEKLQNDMKNYRDGASDDGYYSPSDRDAENSIDLVYTGTGPFLPYHEMMLPHWKKFAKGLEGRTIVKRIYIQGIHLPVTLLDILFPALRQHLINLTTLQLISTNIGSDIFHYLSTFLQVNTTLTTSTLVVETGFWTFLLQVL